MKIYFIASISGKPKYKENYELIVDNIKKLGHKLVSTHVLETDAHQLSDVTTEEERKFYRKVKDWINQADVVVAEVSHPSTNVGHEVSLAINKNKPVVLLHTEDNRPVLFEGLDSEKAQLISYSLDTLAEDLKYALDYASERQDVRFNFFISPRHQNYLDWIAKHRRIPRSVFLRRLIEDHISKNEDYNPDEPLALD